MADRELHPDRSVPVVVATRDAVEAIAGGKHPAGTVSLSGQPSNLDWVRIPDGTNTVIFEFYDGTTGTTATSVHVLIGASTAATMAAFITAVNEVHTKHTVRGGDLLVEAVANGTTACTLHHRQAGSAGNQTVTKSGANITVTGLTGGLNPNMANTAYYGYNAVIAAHTGFATNDFAIETDLGCKATVFKISTDDDLLLCFNGLTARTVLVLASESPWVLNLNELEISRVQIQHYMSGAGDAVVRMFVSGRG